MDMTGVTFSEEDIGDGLRSYVIHDAQTDRRFAVLSSGKPSAEKVRAMLLDWLQTVRKAA